MLLHLWVHHQLLLRSRQHTTWLLLLPLLLRCISLINILLLLLLLTCLLLWRLPMLLLLLLPLLLLRLCCLLLLQQLRPQLCLLQVQLLLPANVRHSKAASQDPCLLLLCQLLLLLLQRELLLLLLLLQRQLVQLLQLVVLQHAVVGACCSLQALTHSLCCLACSCIGATLEGHQHLLWRSSTEQQQWV
jgi:hypothetical protein